MLTITTGGSAPTGPEAPGLKIGLSPAASSVSGPVPLTGGGVSGGSDVYRIAPDGSPARIWTSHEDIVYALAFDARDRLLAGTGNRGHIFAISGIDEFSDLLKAAASQVTAFAKAPGGAVYAASSHLGKIFLLRPGPEPGGTCESACVD